MAQFTVQVNVSPGDAAYAGVTVPALLRAHDGLDPHRMVVLDAVPRPGLRDERTFAERTDRMRAAIAEWKEAGLVDTVLELTPGAPAIARIARRYTRPVTEPFDSRGAPITSYLLPLEAIETGFWIHYDGDMLLSQQGGYDWAREGAERLAEQPRAIAASPRVAPPFERPAGFPDQPSLTRAGARIVRRPDHWETYFFSARCFLVDVERFRSLAPFVRWPYLLEVLARRATNRTYPPFWEVMVHQSYTHPGRMYRLDLASEQAFTLHPADKGDRFLDLAPFILEAIREGKVPTAQEGVEDVDLDAWEAYRLTHGSAR